MWTSPILHRLAYAVTACRPGLSPCGREFDDDEQRTVVVHRLVASRRERHGTRVVCDCEWRGAERSIYDGLPGLVLVLVIACVVQV